MKNFNPGDLVKILPYCEVEDNDLYWDPDMDDEVGKIVTIDHRTFSNFGYKVKENEWVWHEDWLKLANISAKELNKRALSK
jgi:hypothetical protein